MVILIKNEQVSRLLQMPAGVSEHCSVVSQMIIFMMIVLLVNIVTMVAWNELNTILCWWCTHFPSVTKGK